MIIKELIDKLKELEDTAGEQSMVYCYNYTGHLLFSITNVFIDEEGDIIMER